MSDQSVREIQLSSKGLVLLFMASVVVLVAVFLLGVSVGGGVEARRDAANGVTDTTQVADAEPAAEMPPPTVMTPEDTEYHSGLQERATPPAQTPPPEVPEPVEVAPAAAAGAAAATPAPATTTPATTTTTPVPAAAGRATTPPPARATAAATPPPASATKPAAAPAQATAKPPAAAPAAGRGQTFTVQVGAYGSRANAQRQVQQLVAKGYPAFLAPGNAGGMYRVQIGPYQQRAQADSTVARLRREGMKPSVIR